MTNGYEFMFWVENSITCVVFDQNFIALLVVPRSPR